MMGWTGGMLWAPWFVGLLVVALMAVIITAVLVMGRARGGSSSEEESRALRLLDERLARGEIDVEEFSRARELLRRSR